MIIFSFEINKSSSTVENKLKPIWFPNSVTYRQWGENLKKKKWEDFVNHTKKPCSWCSLNIANPGFGGKKQPNCETESLQYHQRKKKLIKQNGAILLGKQPTKRIYLCTKPHQRAHMN